MNFIVKWALEHKGALLTYAVAVFISIYSWSPLTTAQWSIIDDHEIVDAIGPTGNLTFSDIPRLLSKTELNPSSTMTRFRPTYYTTRYIETVLWGATPQYWYIARIAIAVIFAIALARLCLYISNPILSVGFLAWMLSRPYWVDIFARLGPAELYAALGLSLVIVGLVGGIGKGWRLWTCISLVLGIVFAAGSKENFLFLAVLPLWLLGSQWKHLSYVKRTLFASVLCFSAWIALTIMSRLRVAGMDIYAQNVSPESRFGLIHSFAARQDVKIWLGIIIVFWLVMIWIRIYARKSVNTTFEVTGIEFGRDLWVIVGLLIVFACQYFFYNGNLGAPRYLLPSELIKQVSLLISVGMLIKLISIFFAKRLWPSALAVFITVYLFGVSLSGISKNRHAAEQVSVQTKAFTQSLYNGIAFLKKNPSAVVVLDSHSVADYEPIVSIRLFLNYAGLNRPIFIKMIGYSSDDFPIGSLHSILAQGIENRRSNPGESSPITPLQELDLSKICYSFSLSGDPSSCPNGSRVFN